jgi:uncharacterized membrane protein YozB (DUF420 family)
MTSAYLNSTHLALAVSGVIFGLIAIMHLLRLAYSAKVTIGDRAIPMWVSVLGFVIPLCLSLWIFRLSVW